MYSKHRRERVRVGGCLSLCGESERRRKGEMEERKRVRARERYRK